MVRFCLNMIVKNEAARIERALDSAGQFITCAVIVDTGSEDDTKAKISEWCRVHHIPLILRDAPFENWSQARNAALAYAREAWCSGAPDFAFDYILLMDADMELRVFDQVFLEKLGGPSYDVYQYAGPVHYQNRRLLKADQSGTYLGVTHEYLDVETAGLIPETVMVFLDHSDGANRPGKYKRDIRLLKQGLRDEPNNARYMFYLANSYRDAGQFIKAAQWYERRWLAGGWEEECWQAHVYWAHCMKALGRDADFVKGLLDAYQLRPTRAEPLYDLARWYRDVGKQAPALAFAEAGVTIPYSHDALFVSDYVYKVGFLEEIAICAYYVPEKAAEGFRAADKLALMETPYVWARESGRQNLFWYLRPLGDICPSFKWQQIGFVPPQDWIALNPSVTLADGVLRCLVRTVNYRIDENGRYLIRGIADDGTLGTNATAENPIHTRNYLLVLDDTLRVVPGTASELLPPGNMPCKWPMVIGFEDMRLFQWNDRLWTSSTVRQFHPDGNCEQVLAKIIPVYDGRPAGQSWKIGEYRRMLREPRQTEKNWAPWVHGPHLRFMHRMGVVVDEYGNVLAQHKTGLATDHISGGSQLIPWYDGWLALVHEARMIPGSHLRYYWHRFAFYNANGSLAALTHPFVFNERAIEFAAGMCWHPDGKHVVISYGFKDCEARIATVLAEEIHKLCIASKL